LKRNEFIKLLVKEGCYLHRHGRKHDIYRNPRSGRRAPVPRHVELPDSMCKLIRKQLRLDE